MKKKVVQEGEEVSLCLSPVQVFRLFENTHIRLVIRNQSADVSHRKDAVEFIVKPSI
jgi:hypothetical protein